MEVTVFARKLFKAKGSSEPRNENKVLSFWERVLLRRGSANKEMG